MEVIYTIVLHPKVIRDDIPSIDPEWRIRIKDSIESKLTMSPELFGKPLRQTLKNYRKLRVGDYRIVYKIVKKEVFILGIFHRSLEYDWLTKRT